MMFRHMAIVVVQVLIVFVNLQIRSFMQLAWRDGFRRLNYAQGIYLELLKTGLNLYKHRMKQIERWIMSLETRPPKKYEQRANVTQGTTRTFKYRHFPRRSTTKGIVKNVIQIICCVAIAMQADAREVSERKLVFDTDAVSIKVDNCLTATLSNRVDDFIGPLIPVNRKVKGVGGFLDDIYMGTFVLRIEDDDGRTHEVLLPQSYYVPQATTRLLSPQH